MRRLDRRERLVWNRAAAYVTITRGLSDDLAARYGSRKNMFVVPDGSDEPINLPAGSKICQLIVEQIITPEAAWATDLDETARGAGGFGSTG